MRSSAELLQFYVDAGADEAIGDAAVDRTRIVEKNTLVSAVVLPMTPAPVTEPAAPLGAIEALATAKELAAKAQTVDELKAAIQGFDGIALKRTATQIVFADGAPTAKVMLIGEAPNAEEDRAGIPFIGERGQLLDKMLAAIGLNRGENVYVTNVVSWYPPGGSVSQTDITLSLPFIQRHIELVNPAVVVFVGGGAAKALMQTRQSITALRGKWKDYQHDNMAAPIASMALFHPDYLIASPAQKKLAWEDLQMLQGKLKELQIL